MLRRPVFCDVIDQGANFIQGSIWALFSDFSDDEKFVFAEASRVTTAVRKRSNRAGVQEERPKSLDGCFTHAKVGGKLGLRAFVVLVCLYNFEPEVVGVFV